MAQAYFDTIEDRTGKTPRDFLELAQEKGFNATETKVGPIVAWLMQDFALGYGHATAVAQLIKHRGNFMGVKLDGKNS